MANEQGLARDSTLAFTKGVVDVDLALYAEGHHPGQSAFGGPRVVILFLAIGGRNEVRSWAGGNDIEFPAPPFRVQSTEKQRPRMTTELIQLTNQPKTEAEGVTKNRDIPPAVSGTSETRLVVPLTTPINT